jgi:hypothetical protein
MTTVYELTPPEPPTRGDEPPITVRVGPAGVIIQPHPGQLDAGATAALVAAINAAVAAGAAALIDLARGPLTVPDQLPVSPPHNSRECWGPPQARMAGPGFVELAAGEEPWLLDVVGRRLSRNHAENRRFLPPGAWLPVRYVTVSAATVGATTDAGERIVVYRPT